VGPGTKRFSGVLATPDTTSYRVIRWSLWPISGPLVVTNAGALGALVVAPPGWAHPDESIATGELHLDGCSLDGDFKIGRNRRVEVDTFGPGSQRNQQCVSNR
jgi:hypothetical protein